MDLTELDKRDLKVAQFLVDNQGNWYSARGIARRSVISGEEVKKSLDELFERRVVKRLPRGGFSALYRIRSEYKDMEFYTEDDL
ncbi:MAG: hypothetical protein EF811_03880 [Methanonatronarchaeia archaeon]|nr:MAG: hypothetical protein EF811_03880 [Methanonatronarchaeia archaeon]